MPVLLVALVVALACFASVAASAFATPGDSIANAVSINEFNGSSLTTDLVPSGFHDSGQFYLRVYLTANAGFRATFTSGPTVVSLRPAIVGFADSTAIDASHSVLTFQPTTSNVYTIWCPASSMGTFTVAPTISQGYSLSKLTVPSSARKSRSFAVSVRVSPKYQGASSPIRFMITRYDTKKHVYKAYSSYASKANQVTSSYTRYAASVKLAKGTYKIYARFADGDHPKAIATGSIKVTVK
jgi:hypothetical protein